MSCTLPNEQMKYPRGSHRIQCVITPPQLCDPPGDLFRHICPSSVTVCHGPFFRSTLSWCPMSYFPPKRQVPDMYRNPRLMLWWIDSRWRCFLCLSKTSLLCHLDRGLTIAILLHWPRNISFNTISQVLHPNLLTCTSWQCNVLGLTSTQGHCCLLFGSSKECLTVKYVDITCRRLAVDVVPCKVRVVVSFYATLCTLTVDSSVVVCSFKVSIYPFHRCPMWLLCVCTVSGQLLNIEWHVRANCIW